MVQPLPASEVTHARRRLDGGRARVLRDDVGGAGAIPEARDRPPDVQVPRPATPGLGRGGVAGRREAAGRAAAEGGPAWLRGRAGLSFPGGAARADRDGNPSGVSGSECARASVSPEGAGPQCTLSPALSGVASLVFVFFPPEFGRRVGRDSGATLPCPLVAPSRRRALPPSPAFGGGSVFLEPKSASHSWPSSCFSHPSTGGSR